jgi:hypothetical protein
MEGILLCNHPFLLVRLSWKDISGNLRQAKGFVKLSIDEHISVSGDLGTVKFQL